jgi:hypothetical protein
MGRKKTPNNAAVVSFNRSALKNLFFIYGDCGRL